MIQSKLQATRLSDVADIVSTDLPWSKLSGKRVLVSGAGGFLGGYLIDTLLWLHALGKVDEPVQVVAMVRDPKQFTHRLAHFTQYPNLTFMTWDLSTIKVPNVGECDYVIHAASQASPRFFGSDPVGTILPNTIGTAVLLEAMRRSKSPKGFLFVSSSEVYGNVTEDVLINETSYGMVDPTTVRACYAESKRMGETMCIAWHHQHGIPAYIVRPFHTYGPGIKSNDGRVFADFVFNVLRGENIVMNSHGGMRRAFCYVSDAIAGFFSVLLLGNPAQPYNVANATGVLSVKDLAELLVSLYPEKKLFVEIRKSTEDSGYIPSPYISFIPDISRICSLGWSAKIDPATGFRRMIESYQ